MLYLFRASDCRNPSMVRWDLLALQRQQQGAKFARAFLAMLSGFGMTWSIQNRSGLTWLHAGP